MDSRLPQTLIVIFPSKRAISRVSFQLRQDIPRKYYPKEFVILGTNSPIQVNDQMLFVPESSISWTKLAHVRNAYWRDRYSVVVTEIQSCEVGKYQIYGIRIMETAGSSNPLDGANVRNVNMWEVED